MPSEHRFERSTEGVIRPFGEPIRMASHVSPKQLTTDDFGSIESANLEVHTVPFLDSRQSNDNLDVRSSKQLVSIYARDVDLRIVLAHLAEESKVNIVVAEQVQAKITTTLSNVPLWHALDALLKINGLEWTQNQNIIFVTRPGNGTETTTQPATGLGQSLQVFDLNFTSASEVLEVVKGLLSPSGKAFSHAVDLENTRQTRERIVVEDFPERVQAVSQYLASVDNPPQQVLIEANVMQVTLDDSQRHGVNLLGIARVAGARVRVQAQGFADSDASPGVMMGLEGTDLNGMIELLCSTSDVRTLAAPKVLVVNGQQARIQIGSKFGYFVTTTTQTSTLQSVDFLDIGVVLIVEPTITRDGQVLLTVQPKVSGGRINPDTGLPEEDTTEAETTVLLADGKGMIIGGLIKETNEDRKTWAPWLGKQPIIGKLFSKTNQDFERTEVIIALTTHIVPMGDGFCSSPDAYPTSLPMTHVEGVTVLNGDSMNDGSYATFGTIPPTPNHQFLPTGPQNSTNGWQNGMPSNNQSPLPNQLLFPQQ